MAIKEIECALMRREGSHRQRKVSTTRDEQGWCAFYRTQHFTHLLMA